MIKIICFLLISFKQLSTWLSKNTSKQVGLHDRKGEIKVGFDADFVIWDPEEKFEVKSYNFFLL